MDRYAPKPDLQTLLAQRGLRIVDVELRAGMARESRQRVLTGRRDRRMALPPATRLAKAIGVPLQVSIAALGRTLDDKEGFRRPGVTSSAISPPQGSDKFCRSASLSLAAGTTVDFQLYANPPVAATLLSPGGAELLIEQLGPLVP